VTLASEEPCKVCGWRNWGITWDTRVPRADPFHEANLHAELKALRARLERLAEEFEDAERTDGHVDRAARRLRDLVHRA
jgi:hypothetical protein